LITEETRFRKFFGVEDIFRDDIMTFYKKRYAINIIKFDDWMIENHGYNCEIHGSLRNFITNTFGKEACDFIWELLT